MSSIGKRIGASLIDFIGLGLIVSIVFAPILAAALVADASRGTPTMFGPALGFGFGIGYVIGLIEVAILLAYFVALEGTRGQTVGKMLLNMRVVRADGAPMDFAAAFKRRFWFFIGSVIPIPVVGPLVGLGILIWLIVTMSNDVTNRGYHDAFAGTLVVDTR
ncbi:MAG TPA: RDD family protein [Nitriliruptorales bacterium]|nr:RDD family protein [Nitriliruptorales bacterium]